MAGFDFTTIDWTGLPVEEYPGEKGVAFWQTLKLPGLRLRIVEYSGGYLADHWCTKGHIVHCLKGSMVSQLDNGKEFELHEGMCYVVSDARSRHRSFSKSGVRLLIIDGDFLAT